MMNNPKFTPQTKKTLPSSIINVWKHVKTQSNPCGFIETEYCSIEEQFADNITKPVHDDIFFQAAEVATKLIAKCRIMRECENCEGCDYTA
jgi:hypothetical protein